MKNGVNCVVSSSSRRLGLVAITGWHILLSIMNLWAGSSSFQGPGPGAKADESRPDFWLKVAKARQHPSYQVFAHQLRLPAVTVANRDTLRIAENAQLGLRREDRMGQKQRQLLAGEFDVPGESIAGILERVKQDTHSDATRAAAEFRAGIVDYKYLQWKFAQYSPPKARAVTKSQALQALRVGDTEKAWEIYLALPQPAAPGALRVIGGQ